MRKGIAPIIGLLAMVAIAATAAYVLSPQGLNLGPEIGIGAKKPFLVLISVSPDPVPWNGIVDVIVHVEDVANIPIEGANIQMPSYTAWMRNITRVPIVSGVTDKKGNFEVSFVNDIETAPSKIQIAAKVSKIGYEDHLTTTGDITLNKPSTDGQGTQGGGSPTTGGCLRINLPLNSTITSLSPVHDLIFSIADNQFDSLQKYSADFYVTNGCSSSIRVDTTGARSFLGEIRIFTKEGETGVIEPGGSARIEITNSKPDLRAIYGNVGYHTFRLGRPGIASEQYTIQVIPRLTLATRTLAIGESRVYGNYNITLLGIRFLDTQSDNATFNITAIDRSLSGIINVTVGTVGSGAITPVRIALFNLTSDTAVIAVDTRAKAAQPTTDTLVIELVPQMAFAFADGTAITTNAVNISSRYDAFLADVSGAGIKKSIETNTVYIDMSGKEYVLDAISRSYWNVTYGYYKYGKTRIGYQLHTPKEAMYPLPTLEIEVGQPAKDPAFTEYETWHFKITNPPELNFTGDASYSLYGKAQAIQAGFKAQLTGSSLDELSKGKIVLTIRERAVSALPVATATPTPTAAVLPPA